MIFKITSIILTKFIFHIAKLREVYRVIGLCFLLKSFLTTFDVLVELLQVKLSKVTTIFFICYVRAGGINSHLSFMVAF